MCPVRCVTYVSGRSPSTKQSRSWFRPARARPELLHNHCILDFGGRPPAEFWDRFSGVLLVIDSEIRRSEPAN